MDRHDVARAELRAYQEARPRDFFTADSFLQEVLAYHLGKTRLSSEAPGLSEFGVETAGPIDALATETNRDENLPRIRRWEGLGPRRDEVAFHPSYLELGRLVYRTRAIARYARPGEETAQLAYVYLLA